MRTFQENFDLSHRQLLETLTAYATVEAEPHLSNLCARLDFNGYYSSYCAHTAQVIVLTHLTLAVTVADSRAAAASAGGVEGGTQRDLVSAVY